MKISYDSKYNIAYIRFRARRGKVKTLPVSEEVNVDIASDGKIYGMELLNAADQLKITKKKDFSILFDTNKLVPIHT